MNFDQLLEQGLDPNAITNLTLSEDQIQNLTPLTKELYVERLEFIKKEEIDNKFWFKSTVLDAKLLSDPSLIDQPKTFDDSKYFEHFLT